jgi:enoyl-CoA hydratase/carnithine racemase
MPFDNLLVERESRIAVLTVQRPTRLNALDASTLDELRQAALDLQHDNSIRCVIVTGAGEKAFVAGADINEIAGDTPKPRGCARSAASTCSISSSISASRSSPPSMDSHLAADASSPWRVLFGSRPTRRASGSPRSTSA